MKIDCAKPRIIVWTQEEALKEIISSLSGDKGLEVFHVSDQHELFSLLEENQSSLLILDSGLPQIFGFEVYEVIKRIDRFKDTRMMVISPIPRVIEGVDECIDKEHLRDVLLSKIETFMPDEAASDHDFQYKAEENDTDSRFSDPEIQRHEEVKRLAEIIVSDIVLYNQAKAEQGAREGTFYELLKDQIEEGRRFYSSKVPPTILTTTDYFDAAIQKAIQRSLKA